MSKIKVTNLIISLKIYNIKYILTQFIYILKFENKYFV